MPNALKAHFISSELSLTIALVVFVMITLFLITVLVLLCVSKSFRAFFFREHKNTNDVASEPEPVIDQKPEPEPVPEPERPKRRRKTADPFGVPTVPLTFNATERPTEKKRRGKKSNSGISADDIPTIEVEIAPQSDKSTYVTRTLPKKGGKRG